MSIFTIVDFLRFLVLYNITPSLELVTLLFYGRSHRKGICQLSINATRLLLRIITLFRRCQGVSCNDAAAEAALQNLLVFSAAAAAGCSSSLASSVLLLMVVHQELNHAIFAQSTAARIQAHRIARTTTTGARSGGSSRRHDLLDNNLTGGGLAAA